MRNNTTAYNHPTIQAKIKEAANKAKLSCLFSGKDYSTKQYVQNRKGQNIMRIDYNKQTGFTVWGDNSRNITSIVVPVIQS